MNAIRQVFDASTTQLLIDLPPELPHRRLEVIVLPLDEEAAIHQNTNQKRYRTLKVSERTISSRERLHER